MSWSAKTLEKQDGSGRLLISLFALRVAFVAVEAVFSCVEWRVPSNVVQRGARMHESFRWISAEASWCFLICAHRALQYARVTNATSCGLQ